MSLVRSVSTIGGLTLVSRVLGMVRDMLMARYVGAGMASDAFLIAWRLPNLFRALFAEGAMSAVFVPMFTRRMAEADKETPGSGLLAAEVFAERPDLHQVVVSGDARRGLVWAGRFERDARHLVRQAGEWKLLPADARGREWPEAHWVAAGRAPKAEWVGRLFFAGGPSEDLQPIYLHPAVAAPPRFDPDGKPLA